MFDYNPSQRFTCVLSATYDRRLASFIAAVESLEGIIGATCNPSDSAIPLFPTLSTTVRLLGLATASQRITIT